MEREKLISSANLMDRFLKVFQGFAMAGMIVCGIFIPLTAIFGEKMIASADKLTTGEVTIILNGNMEDYLDISKLRFSIIALLVCGVIICAAFWYCLKKFREIIAPMKEGRPFETGISEKIRKLGWTILIAGSISEGCRILANVFELMAYDLRFITSQSAVASITYNYSINLWFVIAALLLFFTSYIFRYGEILQIESDETL